MLARNTSNPKSSHIQAPPSIAVAIGQARVSCQRLISEGGINTIADLRTHIMGVLERNGIPLSGQTTNELNLLTLEFRGE